LKQREIAFSYRTKTLIDINVDKIGSSPEILIHNFFISMPVLAGEKTPFGRLKLKMEQSTKANLL
jgi:hypothetical protein